MLPMFTGVYLFLIVLDNLFSDVYSFHYVYSRFPMFAYV